MGVGLHSSIFFPFPPFLYRITNYYYYYNFFIFFCDFWQIVELRIIIGVAKSSYNKVDTDQWWLGVLILRKACGYYTHAFTDNNFPSLMMCSMYSMRKTLKARQSS